MQAQVSGPSSKPPTPPSAPPPGGSKAQQSQSAGAAANSIGAMIYRIVLIEFLGTWNAQLAAAATNANFLSGSVSFYNEIAKDLADFNLADSHLNFSSKYPKTSDGKYTGNADDAKAAVKKEAAWAQKQKDQITKEKAKIADEQAKLDKDYADGKITKDQYTKLSGQLSDLNTQLTKASQALTSLINDLNAITITVDPNNSNQFTIGGAKDIMEKVSSMEKLATTRLSGVYNTVTNNQSDYTTASTNAQMSMQLLLSQSGQIMSALSTILSLLSQAESGVAQNIK